MRFNFFKKSVVQRRDLIKNLEQAKKLAAELGYTHHVKDLKLALFNLRRAINIDTIQLFQKLKGVFNRHRIANLFKRKEGGEK